MSTEAAIDAQSLRLGARIREFRHARRLTLVQLADAAGLSHSFLSQLERGLARPSMASLERIARALGSSQLELLAATDDGAQVGPRAARGLVRAGEGSRGHYGGDAQMLVSGRRRFLPMLITGVDLVAGDYFTHEEDEFVHCLDGGVRIELLGQETQVLGAGDSLYYVGGTPHRWSATAATGYRLLVVKETP